MFYKYKVLFTVLIATITVGAGMAQDNKAAEQHKRIPDKKIELIIGSWKIQTIMSGKTEVAKNPTSGQWIEFREDGKYVNKATALDSGSYRLNENSSTLYLESSVKAKVEGKNVSEFNIAFEGELMTMQQAQKKTSKKTHTDAMKYVYVRIADGSNHLNN
ncbi:MAG: hypothetical protein WKF87_20255 [Chryseolinea sp.]